MTVFPIPFGHAQWRGGRRRREAAVALAHERRVRLAVVVSPALRDRVERSAELEGVSPGTWVARALARSVDPRLA